MRRKSSCTLTRENTSQELDISPKWSGQAHAKLVAVDLRTMWFAATIRQEIT
jgi:hypothetical protein